MEVTKIGVFDEEADAISFAGRLMEDGYTVKLKLNSEVVVVDIKPFGGMAYNFVNPEGLTYLVVAKKTREDKES